MNYELGIKNDSMIFALSRWKHGTDTFLNEDKCGEKTIVWFSGILILKCHLNIQLEMQCVPLNIKVRAAGKIYYIYNIYYIGVLLL